MNDIDHIQNHGKFAKSYDAQVRDKTSIIGKMPGEFQFSNTQMNTFAPYQKNLA